MSRTLIASVVAIGYSFVGVSQANAAIAFVQKGTEASGGGVSMTATLPAGTTAGDLLVATIEDVNSGCASDSYSAPAGWSKASQVCRGSTGPIEIWYLPNVTAGVTSVVFNTGSSGANSIAQLSEWSGAATSSPLDQSGTATNASSSTTLTVTTTGNVAATGELAITGFDTSAGLSSFTPGTSWNSLRSDPGNGMDSDYRINPPSGSTLSEAITSNPGTSFGGVIATFKSAACSGGSLTVEAPSSAAFPSLTLNPYGGSVTTSFIATPDDESGSGSGWNLDITSTTLTSAGHTLPTTATTITSASSSAATGNCSLPTNSIGYPLTIPAAGTAPAAISLFNAALGTGKGPTNVTFGAKIAAPGRTFAGSYASTWTLTMASGP